MIAGTGTNDTAQAVNLTERATALGADAMLVVTPYYNRPSRLGLLRHYEAVAAATDKPIILYNIPGRTGTNMPPDLLAELAQIPKSPPSSRRTRRSCSRSRASSYTPATTRASRARWSSAAPGESSSPANRGAADAPDGR